MSDEWIVQLGGVFVELEEIIKERISKRKPTKMIYFSKFLHARVLFNNAVSLFLHKNTRSTSVTGMKQGFDPE